MDLTPDPSNKFIAPDFKRRQLLFDSFSKLQQNTSSSTTATRSNASNSSGSGNSNSGSNNNSNNSGNNNNGNNNAVVNAENSKGTLLYSWGAGYHGQLGLNTARKKCRLVPSCIVFDEPVQMVACGGFHTAVLTDDGRVYTWGDGRLGQLGNLIRKHNMHSTPHLVDYLVSYKVSISYIACGQYHTAAVSTNGRLFTWGSGKWGQLGHGVRQDERFPRKIETDKSLGNFVKVACGDRHTIALNDAGGVVTFGNGQHGQLGHGNGLDQLRPTLLNHPELAAQKVVQVDCGAITSAAVTVNGALYLWGFGESLHPKGVSNVLESPLQVQLSEPVKQVACGLGHVLVLTDNGDVYAFGVAGMGQVGHGGKNNIRMPRLILRGKEIHQVAAGRYHSMAVTAYGITYSWGCGESGQLGNAALENESLPCILTDLLPNVVGHLACGEHHSLALTSIAHAAVSSDVANWKLIEDSEHKLKVQMASQVPNGLKTKHILQIEQERKNIIRQLAESLRRDKEEKAKNASEKMNLIASPTALLEEVQSMTSKHGLANTVLGRPSTGSVDFSIGTVDRTDESYYNDDNEDGVVKKNSKHLEDLINEMNSTSVSLAASRQRSPAHSPREGSASLLRVPGNEYDEKEMMVVAPSVPNHRSEQSISTLSSTSNNHLEVNGTIQKHKSNDSTALLVRNATTPALGNTPVAFAPLAPRISFIEQTNKTLARVRSFMTANVIPNESTYNQELLRVKKQYNALHNERKRLMNLNNETRAELLLCRPNSEEQVIMNVSLERVKQLNMKLVTLNTRLMEAEENKKNYELYIIRMKEEDLQLGKQIDHLRSICAEYERLLQKLEKMNRRVSHQRIEVVEETHNFIADVQEFMSFADRVVKDYRHVLNASYKQSLYQESLLEQRAQRSEDVKEAKTEALKKALMEIQSSQNETRAAIEGWEDKVEYYDKRFRKVAAATGLTRADSIISKYYFNDEITRDLKAEVERKEDQLQRLEDERNRLTAELNESKANVSVRKWKDVSLMEEENAATKLEYQRTRDECEKWTSRLTTVFEGINSVNRQLGQLTNNTEEMDENDDDDHGHQVTEEERLAFEARILNAAEERAKSFTVQFDGSDDVDEDEAEGGQDQDNEYSSSQQYKTVESKEEYVESLSFRERARAYA